MELQKAGCVREGPNHFPLNHTSSITPGTCGLLITIEYINELLNKSTYILVIRILFPVLAI